MIKKIWNKIKYWLLAGLGIGIVFAVGGQMISDKSFEDLSNVKKEVGLYKITYDKYSDIEIKDQDTPEVKLRRWEDECFIKITYPDFSPVSPKQEESKLKWKNGKKEVHLYPIDDKKFEFEIILKEKPLTNKIVLNIESKGLNFYYQPELTQKEKDEGHFRPENVIGSYAVYHESKANHIIGQKNYKTGKAFHIYRPQMIDANGWKVWGELNIANGKMTITIQQDFIDKAVYPLIVDPTFGYTSIGGSWNFLLAYKTAATISSTMVGNTQTLSENGRLDSLHAVIGISAGTFPQSADVFLAIYDEDSGGSGSHDLVASVESLNETIILGGAWVEIAGASENLTAGSLILAALVNGDDIADNDTYIRIADDSVGTRNYYNETSTGSGGYAIRKAEDPWTETATSGSFQFSIYCTYTAGWAARRIIITE